MRNRIFAAGLAGLALATAAPALAQGQPAAEAQVKVTAVPGVVAPGAQWRTFWSGPMIVDGMAAAADGALLFAQEQSNSIIKVWPDGRWWVEYPFVAGAGSVSLGKDGTIYAADRSCTDPGLGLGANCTVPSKIVQLAPERKTIADKFADGKTLGRINDLAADGHVSGKRTVATIAGEPEGSFGGDGLAVDADGRLYVTTGQGIVVFDKAGQQLGAIPVPRRAITVAIGGPEGKTLYAGTLGANTPAGANWQTPQGVRNIAATIYAIDVLPSGVRK